MERQLQEALAEVKKVSNECELTKGYHMLCYVILYVINH